MSDPSHPSSGPAGDTLAAATARVAARQRAIAATRQAQHEASSTARRHTERISRLPGILQSPARRGLDTWDVIRSRTGTRPAFRVGQADAELLDEELLELLKGQVREGLKGFGGWIGGHDHTAEIMLVLRAVLFKLSIWDHDASYGATLQGLKYTDARGGVARRGNLKPPTRWQKVVYGLVTVPGTYAWAKWEDWLLDQEVGYSEPSPLTKRLSRITSLLTTTHSVATLFSFLAFLLNGRYRTILDRILRMRLAAPANQISREISFEYLNRQLVWHAFTEFLLFILPLVGIARWRRWLARAWRRTKLLIKKGTSGLRDGATEDDEEEEDASGELGFLPERTCAICYQDQNPVGQSEQEIIAATGAAGGGGGGLVGSAQTDVTNAYETVPCGHVYCFVCLAGRIEAEEGEGWVCLRCGELCRACRPWAGDVVEELSRPGSTGNAKSVRFEDVRDARGEERGGGGGDDEEEEDGEGGAREDDFEHVGGAGGDGSPVREKEVVGLFA